ncbi:vomeronasal type-2 receptor 26-like [Polypterus senegalus]|uniref:vomeronasal type-2 receptor 26-like n=1 Tax=Polypterus senegalus TaxID=55291 RepID=UPI001966B3B2|nr:vomeronasal type-2 receptor 26-like [Polypterus senegalus]
MHLAWLTVWLALHIHFTASTAPTCQLKSLRVEGLKVAGDVIIGATFPVHENKVFPNRDFTDYPGAVQCYSFSFRSYRWLHAMMYAIEEINASPTLLPNITLGYSIYDSCDIIPRGIEGVLWMVSGTDEVVLNYRCYAQAPLAAVIGDSASSVSIPMTNILGIYNYPQILHYMKNVHFTTWSGEEIYFDENGDPPALYDIVNWKPTTSGDIQYFKVGSYDSSAPPGKELVLIDSTILWPGEKKQVPLSVCSESCLPGWRKATRQGQPICCFDCIPCSEGEISSHKDSTECLPCPDDQWPNERRDICVPKMVEFLSYSEPLGMVLAVLSVLISVVPKSILGLFLWYRHTPIVKANNRQLSYVLLCALTLCPLCSFIFIGKPSSASCILRQTTFAIIFALSVSCVLAKTIMVIIAFKASKPGSNLHRWVGSRLPNTIACLGTLIQAGICALWLGYAPPFPQNNMNSQVGKIILECNEGSSLAFWCMMGYMGILAVVSFVIAFLARKLPDSFNEAKFITFSMLVFVIVWLSFIPSYLSTRGKYTVAVEIFAILSSSAGLLSCIFFPKCYIILLKPERNTRDFLMGKGTSTNNK